MKRYKLTILTVFAFLVIILSGCGQFGYRGVDIELPEANGTIDAYRVAQALVDAAEPIFEEQSDDYAAYFPPDEYQSFIESSTGNYRGIGVYMYDDGESGHVVVQSAMKGSPAQKAGLQSGDQFLKVDGEDVSRKDSTYVSTLIKGSEADSVDLVVFRPEQGEVAVTVEISAINVPSVEANYLDKVNKIGYISIAAFNHSTAQSFQEELNNLVYQGIEYLIVDLRNNGGGEVEQALAIADMFVPADKVLLHIVERGQTYSYPSDAAYVGIPTVLLQNENSASASEMLIGSLTDNGVAQSVGVQSFGKGIVQTIWPLSEGGGVRITTAQYLTPNGKSIHKVGITPNKIVEMPEDADALAIYTLDPTLDVQLDAAMRLLLGLD